MTLRGVRRSIAIDFQIRSAGSSAIRVGGVFTTDGCGDYCGRHFRRRRRSTTTEYHDGRYGGWWLVGVATSPFHGRAGTGADKGLSGNAFGISSTYG